LPLESKALILQPRRQRMQSETSCTEQLFPLVFFSCHLLQLAGFVDVLSPDHSAGPDSAQVISSQLN